MYLEDIVYFAHIAYFGYFADIVEFCYSVADFADSDGGDGQKSTYSKYYLYLIFWKMMVPNLILKYFSSELPILPLDCYSLRMYCTDPYS